MEIVILRHGTTAGNAGKAYIGSLDVPVSEEGLAEARRIPADESVRTCYITPYRRTRQTAEILYPNATYIPVADLREIDFGVFEGRQVEELKGDPQYQQWAAGNFQAVCPGGESFEGLGRRAVPAFLKTIAQAQAEGAGTIHFVLHGCVISVLMMLLANDHKDFWDYACDNLCGFRLTPAGTTHNGLPEFSYVYYQPDTSHERRGLWKD